MAISSPIPLRLEGTVNNSQIQQIPTNEIERDTWPQPHVQHSYQNLTECPCGFLDRFSDHGSTIREAYENAVVAAIGILNHQDIIIAVVGSGGLLQEACWLTKLFHQNEKFTQISLHLIDTDYATDLQPIDALAKYVRTVLRERQILVIQPWSSWKALQEMVKQVNNLSPHLVIGMDTEHATNPAVNYQWNLTPGDSEKTLFIRWVKEQGETYVKIYSRNGSAPALNCKPFLLSEYKAAGQYIKNAAFVG